MEADTGTVTETYVCPEGYPGRYRVLVKPIWGKVAAGKVTVEVTTHKGTDQEQTIRQQIPVEDEPVAVVFNLDRGRRMQPLADHQVATIEKTENTLSRAMLAQQINSLESSDAARALAVDRFRTAQALGLVPFRGAVGFRPVVTPLPEGTNLSATAVISADRRYVRITPSPLFSGVTDVFTFNFVTGAEGHLRQHRCRHQVSRDGGDEMQGRAEFADVTPSRIGFRKRLRRVGKRRCIAALQGVALRD